MKTKQLKINKILNIFTFLHYFSVYYTDCLILSQDMMPILNGQGPFIRFGVPKNVANERINNNPN